MAGRHVPTRRLQSGVLFSAPDETQRFPPDEDIRQPKILKVNNIQRRIRIENVNCDSSSSTTAPGHPVSLAISSAMPGLTQAFMPPSLKEGKTTMCLPILKVSSTTMIEGTLAHTAIIQSFRNPSEMAIDEARHTFPLYDGAVVTEFECTIGDERRLRGVVKSKEQAQKEYKNAVYEQAKAAALLEEHTPEIFETSLGNIPSATTVEIKIVYIQELKVVMMEGEATEGVVFIVPTSIAPRYGKFQPASGIICDGLDIKIMVLNDGSTNPDGCQEESGHKVFYDGPQEMEPRQRSDGSGEQPLREYHCWEHHSDKPTLAKDFVFVIQMKKGHEMQSQAIVCPPDDAGMAAMMVSIRPSDLFRNAIIPQSFSGEILLMLDQSSSMNERVGKYNGPRKIDVLREAMFLVISGLPKTCSFNIISWGSETWAMWEHAKGHSPSNIKDAKDYISQIDANLRGTDLLRALKSTVQRRQDHSKSTQIIVLTDGQLNPNKSMEFVWKTRQALQNKIRFFTLGIGGNVPHRLIEGIAKLGGGFGDIVDTTQNPRWHGRLNRLLKSALEPDSWNCDIDIGQGFERKSLVDFRLNGGTSDPQRVPYLQAPYTITALHPFTYTSIFFLIDVKDCRILPTEVTIITTTNGMKKKTYGLPVRQMTGRDGTMHKLAAKAALTDLEYLVKQESSNSPQVGDNAQTIGIRYSITSKWTSFAAVPQDETTTTTVEGSMVEHYKAMYEDVGFHELLATTGPDSDDCTDCGYNPDNVEDTSSSTPALFPTTCSYVPSYKRKACKNQADSDGPSQEECEMVSKRVRSKIDTPRARRITRGKERRGRTTRLSPDRFAGSSVVKSIRWRRATPDMAISFDRTSESESREEGNTLLFPKTIDPLKWEITVKHQNGQGLFELPESTKRLLYLHFCPNAALVAVERLETLLQSQGIDQGVSNVVLVDTIMTIMCYQTHLALEEDLWDLMMERAQNAVTETIGQDTMEVLEDILTASMMHQHYTILTGVNDNEDGWSTGREICPVCGVRWQSLRTFFCQFDHDIEATDVFKDWAEFWKHQKETGHMVCPRESTEE
ncbi:hypothetical protein ACHAPY_004382 [Fusarium culmorum]